MTTDRIGLRAARWTVAALALLLLPAISACTTSEGTNALQDPGTFEREVMDTTLQGLDIIPQDTKTPDATRRAPLVMPKQVAQLPPPTKDNTSALPADDSNPQINTKGLSDADIQRLRSARVLDLTSINGRALTDTEQRELAARMQLANAGSTQGAGRSLILPPTSYFSSYKGKDYVCKAADGTLVALNDSRCPVQIRNAIHRDTGPMQSVDQQINSEMNAVQNSSNSN